MQTIAYKKLRRKLFPTPSSFTAEQCESIIKELHAMPKDEQRTVFSMLLGTNTARVSSPQKTYQMSARIFFDLLKEAIATMKADMPTLEKDITSEPIPRN